MLGLKMDNYTYKTRVLLLSGMCYLGQFFIAILIYISKLIEKYLLIVYAPLLTA